MIPKRAAHSRFNISALFHILYSALFVRTQRMCLCTCTTHACLNSNPASQMKPVNAFLLSSFYLPSFPYLCEDWWLNFHVCVCVCALHTWYVCCVEEACLCVSWWALSSRFTSRGIAPASLSDAWLAGHSARFRMSPTVAWTQKRDQDLFLKVIHVANPNGTSCYCLSIHSSALKFADQSVVLHI